MLRKHVAAAIVLACVIGQAFTQDPVKIDFGRDVRPIFMAHCIECHGPNQQKNGFRLDRRRDAMKGGTATVIGPGNSIASRLYLRLVGNRFGTQMPPEGPLSAEQINIIKTWIDQGAVWPDDLAGETPASHPDPKATRMMESLREGDHAMFRKMLREAPEIAGLKGPGGATPLMYAVLYGDADSVRLLLENGADPNVRNEAGATALMWAVDDLEKTRILLKSGALANALSEDARTPLLIATGRYGAGPVVKLLLDHGANPSVKAHGPGGATTPLRQAANVGDDAVLRMLLQGGADVKGAGIVPLIDALNSNNNTCIDLLIGSADRSALNRSLLALVPPRGNPDTFNNPQLVKKMIELGADVAARDAGGRTVLSLAASSDRVSVETIQTLIDSGADVNAKSADGETVLDFAKWRGKTSLVDMLMKAGAKGGDASTRPLMKPKPAASIRAAIERSIPLLQRADATFIQRTGCVSCHHNSLTAMTVAMARKKGIPVDEPIARQQVKAVAAYVESWRERRVQGFASGGDAASTSSTLLGLAASGYAPDTATDAWARYLKNRQARDGRWWHFSRRPPIEASDIQVTAASMRSIQVYAPKARRAEYENAIQRGADWLKKAQPQSNEDLVFQILGLEWVGGSKSVIKNAVRELLSQQRSDGGWGQLP
jgi:ankyrin repeat protein